MEPETTSEENICTICQGTGRCDMYQGSGILTDYDSNGNIIDQKDCRHCTAPEMKTGQCSYCLGTKKFYPSFYNADFSHRHRELHQLRSGLSKNRNSISR